MDYIGSTCGADFTTIFPFLVFLYNCMVSRSDLRNQFVESAQGSFNFGLHAFVKIFCSLKTGQDDEEESSEDADK